MPHPAVFLAVLGGALVVGFLLLWFNARWVYRWFDHALVRDRKDLPGEYERPRYFKLNQRGELDTSVRWPGWDGWYFFMIPEDESVPTKMIRGSLMTGLYGLDGVDNYEKVKLRLSTFESVEYLSLIPTLERVVGRKPGKETIEKENHLSQHYLPKKTDLRMRVDALDTAITAFKVVPDEEKQRYGRIRGSWPNYELEFCNPEAEISFSLRYTAENIVWWADLPCIFTYFASFGRFEGKITYHRGTRTEDVHQLAEGKDEVHSIRGRGCFEHGFARKRFDFDRLWLPIRLVQRCFPSFRPVRYHYELFLGDQNYQGGFMDAQGFGITVRNRGGFYWKGEYKEIKSVRIKYLNSPEPDLVDFSCAGRPPVEFPRSWEVEAETEEGLLSYTGTREWPPAAIASNMIYYHFSYKGSYQREDISGKGYGEYVHL